MQLRIVRTEHSDFEQARKMHMYMGYIRGYSVDINLSLPSSWWPQAPKKAMQMNLKHRAKPPQASISQSKKAVQPSALSTQSTPGSYSHASVEEIEDEEDMHVGGTLERDSDVIMELSDDEAERS